MLANPDLDRLLQALDGLVVEPAFGAIDAFDQHHPAGQARGGTAVVQKGQPGASAEGMRLGLGIADAAQALEQGIELLQPLIGRLAVIGFAQLRQLVEGDLPLRFERGLGHGVVLALAPPGLDSPQQQAAQQPGGEKPPARSRRPPGYRGRSNQRRQLVQWVHRRPSGLALRYSRNWATSSYCVLSGIRMTRRRSARRCQRAMRASPSWR